MLRLVEGRVGPPDELGRALVVVPGGDPGGAGFAVGSEGAKAVDQALGLALAGQPFSEIRNALPFRDDEAGKALRDKVDPAITTLKENGTLAEISNKWFGADITAK